MHIHTIRDNLKATIAGKEKLLADLYPTNPYSTEFMEECDTAVRKATIGYLRVNIGELNRILQDIEQCRPEWTPSTCPYAESESCHRMD